jgi:eukaryotic-like serine/threonine-protein kinase
MQHQLDIIGREPTISEHMQCPSCGIQNPGHSSFCVNCGVAIFADENKPHLGHYRLESKLGEGGMGVVYRAIDEKLHREVAIKVLHPHLLKHENLKERFRREARMHAKIIHPNIVTLLSLYEDGDHMALVMEMIHGKNLKEYLREHPRLDLTDIIRISEAVLSGLDAAHRQGMVHRDLKPANVMLATNGDIKLMDFGLAKPKHGDDDLTQSGATVGSFRYMAPEQILNQPVDGRTDLYAFGILLYQMLTGRLPFDSSSSGGEFEIMEKQVRHEPVPPIEINPNIPGDLSDLVVRMLAKDKENRPGSCEAVQRKLLEILSQAERLLRGHASQIINRPPIQPEQSSGEIARGLIRAWSRQFVRLLNDAGYRLRPWLWEKPAAYIRAALHRQHGTAPQTRMSMDIQRLMTIKWQGPAVWAGVIVALLVVGWALISVIHVAERPVAGGPATPPVKAVQEKEPVKVEIAKSAPQPKPAAPSASSTAKEDTSTKVATVTKEHPKAAPAKAKPRTRHKTVRKSRPKPRTAVAAASDSRASITYRVSYQISNSESDEISPHKPNEFRGGSRLYFPSLKDNRTDFFRAFKKGWVRLYFDQPVHLSAINIHKISISSGDFKGGNIELAVQDDRGHWTVLFRSKNKVIDSPLLIHGSPAAMAQVKGVRLRFTSPEPLTVGPIDLLP